MLQRAAALVALLTAGCGAAQASSTAATVPHTPYVPPPVERSADTGAATALAFAQAQVGKQYCWGGSGPRCFDCSGLVQAAWRAAGVRLPRTTDAQGSALPSVAVGDARPGDLFWWKHGHVGIYAGNGWLIDAYHTGAGVVVRPAPMPDRILRVEHVATSALPAPPRRVAQRRHADPGY